MKALFTLSLASLALAGLSACTSPQDLQVQSEQLIRGSFRDQGIAKVDRLNQDLAQAACSTPNGPTDADISRVLTKEMGTIQWPKDGNYFGDFKRGETLAQSGRGMTWTDKSSDPKDNGGNCYNCHQISKQELSYGTIGPSLYNYGKLRGVTDPYAPSAAPMVQYTWGKLWNAKAYAACSSMPRFGHMKLLNEGQIRDLMSLLLDPKSPVNQ